MIDDPPAAAVTAPAKSKRRRDAALDVRGTMNYA
jgi:hypothetical protein